MTPPRSARGLPCLGSAPSKGGKEQTDVREYPAVKGSVWALFFSGGRLAAADYYPDLTSPLP